MKIEVKLYSYHDMDLVSLYKSGRVAFPETTRQILNSYANKEVYKVKLLPVNKKREKKYPSDTYKKYYHYHINLDDNLDAKAISLLESITPGCRNNFIKVVLRQYICCEIPAGYSVSGDTKLFRSMARLFQGELNEREIKQTRKRQNNKQEDLGTKKRNKHNKRQIDKIESKLSEDEDVVVRKQEKEEVFKEEFKEEIINGKEKEPYTDDFDNDEFDIDAFLSGATDQY